MLGRPWKISLRFRHWLSTVYASETRSGSRVFQASSAARIFWIAVSSVNGGSGDVPLTFGPPGDHAVCQESDRAADPTRSLPTRSPT